MRINVYINISFTNQTGARQQKTQPKTFPTHSFQYPSVTC